MSRHAGAAAPGRRFPTRRPVCPRNRCKKRASLTAGAILHSSDRTAMARREGNKPLSGRVEMDNARRRAIRRQAALAGDGRSRRAVPQDSGPVRDVRRRRRARTVIGLWRRRNGKPGDPAALPLPVAAARAALRKTRRDRPTTPGASVRCPAGDPGRIRTCGLRIRNPPLYPTELRGLDASVTRRGGCVIIRVHRLAPGAA